MLNTGTASEDVLQLATQLLADRGGLRGLAASDLVTLQATRGIGAAKATTVAAAFELGRRIALEGDDLRPPVMGPNDIARLVQAEMELLHHEELRLLGLDTKHWLLSNQCSSLKWRTQESTPT
ncbi:MAG: hypothetical protein EXR66_05860 [Dehalococcoidia bacterium]|nr:hypothetical protein [Dehalococcoidia bacterium]